MDMTLDEALEEIDRWKSAVVDQVAKLPPEERAKVGHEAIAWLEREIGRPLQRVAPPEHEPAPTA
ncbi:MAG TPA: hypothetical protein VGM03_21845 [Phycisphaerae bacterium]|jgi:hypothetical protein